MLGPLAIFGISNWGSFLTDLLAFFSIYLAISVSLNLEMGYAGIPNFGKVLYFAGGAAFSGSVAIRVAAILLKVGGNPVGTDNFIIANSMTTMLQHNIPVSLLLIGVTVLVGGLVGAFLGYISIFPAIRLREDYLAMLLLGAAAFFQIFLNNYSPVINGTFGIGIPDLFAWAGSYSTLAATLMITAFALIVYVYAERLVRSPLGRTLRAMRDNEAASEALGKDTVTIRRNVLIIAAVITGITGALFTIYSGDTNPGNLRPGDVDVLAVADRDPWGRGQQLRGGLGVFRLRLPPEVHRRREVHAAECPPLRCELAGIPRVRVRPDLDPHAQAAGVAGGKAVSNADRVRDLGHRGALDQGGPGASRLGKGREVDWPPPRGDCGAGGKI